MAVPPVSGDDGGAIAQLQSVFKEAQALAMETQKVTTKENGILAVYKKQINA